MAYSKIRPRRGTLYEWSTYNPVLESGEIAIEYPDTGIGTGLCKIKIGNGTDKYTELAYAFDGTAADSIDGGSPSAFSIIQLRAGSARQWYDVNPILNRGEAGYCFETNSIKVGDGETAWNDLEYIRSSAFIDPEQDFGNEEVDPVYGDEYQNIEHNIISSAEEMPDHILPTTEELVDNGGIEILNTENNTDESAGLQNLLVEDEDEKDPNIATEELDFDGGGVVRVINKK